MFFTVKESGTSKAESRKKYVNERVAMEQQMKEAQEEIEEMKKQKESQFISSRK